MTPFNKVLRPEWGQVMRLRGGPLVKVESVGMRWARIIFLDSGKTGQVRYTDLLPVESAVEPKPDAATTKKRQEVRPSMTELDKEFLTEKR